MTAMDSEPPHPHSSADRSTDSSRRIVIIALGVAAFCTYVGLGLVGLKQSYDREMEFARRSQENLAKVLEGHARSTVDKVDTVLMAGQLRLNQAFAGEAMDTATINATLSRYLALIDESQSLRIA